MKIIWGIIISLFLLGTVSAITIDTTVTLNTTGTNSSFTFDVSNITIHNITIETTGITMNNVTCSNGTAYTQLIFNDGNQHNVSSEFCEAVLLTISIVQPTGTLWGTEVFVDTDSNGTVQTWWFSLDGGVTNYTYNPIATTSLNTTGTYEINVWANNSEGNIATNTSQFSFYYTTGDDPLAVQDFTILLILALGFSYAVVYRKNRFVGNIMFMVVGGMAFLSTAVYAAPVGLVVLFGAFISLVYDGFSRGIGRMGDSGYQRSR
jgi:hypothetical protein